MKLYYSPGTCSLSPHILLRETGTPFEAVKVSLATHKTEAGADYYAINPKGAVPALELDDGSVLTEGAAIVQYIGDKAGNAMMPAAGTMDRYRQNEWLNYISTEVHKGFSGLFNKELAAKSGDVIKAKLATQLAYLDTHFAKHDYLMGTQFTAADAYAFTVLGWGQYVGVDTNAYANVAKFQARIGARPKVQETLTAEG